MFFFFISGWWFLPPSWCGRLSLYSDWSAPGEPVQVYTSFLLLASHLSKIANIPMRNIGFWAGNLMLTHDHDNFPSDVFTMMARVGAKVTIGELLSDF